MKANMYYAMGFPSSCDHTKSRKNADEVNVKLSHFVQQKLHAHLLMTPIVIYNPISQHTEMLLISKLEFTEDEWEALMAPATPPTVLRLQTGVMIEPDQTAPCIDRLILNQIKIYQQQDPSLNVDSVNVEEALLDAYRIGTHGLMHHLDHRPWKMKKSDILRLHKLQESVNISVAEAVAKRKKIGYQMQMRDIILEHANTLLRRDPVKYSDVVFSLLEDHDLEVKKLIDQEIDIISEMDALFTKSEQIIKVLKRQVDIQTMIADQKSKSKRNINDDNDKHTKQKPRLE